MSNKISQQELAASFAARKGLPKKQAELFVRTMFEIVQEYVLKEGLVKIKGLGTFKLISVESRSSVDVSTGERIQIESHSKITFTPDKGLADQVNKPFAGFTTVILNPDTKLEDMESMELNESLLPELKPEELVEDSETENLPDVEIEEEVPADEEVMPVDEEEVPAADDEEEVEKVVEEQPKAEEYVITFDEQTEQPEAGQEEEKDMTNESKTVDSEVIRQMVMRAVNREMKKQRGVVLSWGWVATCMLLVLALLIGSFMLGYRMGGDANGLAFCWPTESKTAVKKPEVRAEKTVVNNPKKKDAPVKAEEPADTTRAKPKAPETPTELQVKPVKAKPVVKYEQMPGGAYEIVGVKGEHVMKAGDNLLKIARKNYGDMKLASYIVFFNHIENPDVVPLGAKLKLPELVKK